MLDFDTAINLFKADRIRELSSTAEGMRFLKLRSLSRKDQLECLINRFEIAIGNVKSRGWLKLICESGVQSEDIDEIILELYENERKGRRQNEQQLVNELRVLPYR